MTKTIAELLQDLDDDTDTLGQLMATNLNTMGVTTASASDGLTTLANKILDIDTSGTLTLTTNKSILSYYDSETATLTATHSLGAGQLVSVYNAVSGAKIGDMTDNQDGTYSYTYNSTGVGDISMTCATTSGESNSISIEDCYYADIGTTDKHSNWDTSSSTDTITYDSTNQCYNIVKTRSNDDYLYFTNNLIPKNVKITYDVKTNVWDKNTQPRLGLATGDEQVTGRFASYDTSQQFIAILRHNGSTWNEFTATNVSTSGNTWYTVEITVDGNSWTIKLYNGSTLLGTATATVTTLTSNSNKLILDNAYSTGASISIKNLKVKAL